MRVGAVDIGTNTVRLLVAEVDHGSVVDELVHRAIVTRLGQGVDESGSLHPDAASRTLEVLEAYGSIMDRFEVEARRVVATSAARDAANADEFLERAFVAVRQRPEVISGAEEAALSFTGATLGRSRRGPVLVVDLGGGSTEFVVGIDQPTYAHSVDIGSVRLTERHLASAPARPSMVEVARNHVAALFRDELDLPQITEVTGVAGTYTTLCAIYLDLSQYDRARVNGTVMSQAVLEGLVARLARMTLGEIEAIPSLDPGRGPVILAGAVIAEQALAISGCAELTVSENDILQGIALSIV